ncbi:hypothetical protein ACOMHN_065251 [Nucella lapillus]
MLLEGQRQGRLPQDRLNTESMDNDRLASTMYSATTSALSHHLSHLSHGLVVCVRVQDQQAVSGGPCTYSTVLWPGGKGRAVPRTGSSLQDKVVVLYALLLWRWAF